MEFLNEATGEWQEAPTLVNEKDLREWVDVYPVRIVDREQLLALFAVLDAAQAVAARYDGGTFSDADYRVLRSIFGDALDTLHAAVGRFV